MLLNGWDIDSPLVTMAFGIGIAIAKQYGCKAWHHMVSSISDGNPGILCCYCNPKTSSLLSRKHRESQSNNVAMSWGVGGSPTRLYGVGVPVVQHKFREFRESGHSVWRRLGKEGAGMQAWGSLERKVLVGTCLCADGSFGWRCSLIWLFIDTFNW